MDEDFRGIEKVLMIPQEDPILEFKKAIMDSRSGNKGVRYVRNDEEANEAIKDNQKITLALYIGDVVYIEFPDISFIAVMLPSAQFKVIYCQEAFLHLKGNNTSLTNGEKMKNGDNFGLGLKDKVYVLFRFGRPF